MIIDCDSDRFVREVIECNEYAYLFKDLVVLDIGCNIGTFSFWINKLAKEIHAVDIAQENIDIMNKTIRENKIENIKTYCCAIAGGSSKRYIQHDVPAQGGSWKIVDHSDLMMEAYSLNHFMTTENIGVVDVLKLDVEGAEYEILQAQDFPKNKIRTIVGECHNSIGEGYTSVYPILTSMGYRVTGSGLKFLARI